MKRLKWLLFIYLLPALALAEGSGGVTFRPPETDLSIKLLGYIFGLVDGVLYGTGSQIVGEMFGIFNASVLALGAMVISYTTVISIINTAHQGTVLGKKWSTIMVPLRSVVAVGLLIPKASGYCSIQIFVMWVVVQGVGAADTIWNQALGYIARGGVLIDKHPLAKPPPKPSELIANFDMYGSLEFGAGTHAVKQLGQQVQYELLRTTSSGSAGGAPMLLDDKKQAAANILKSLICMYSLEKILNEKREQLIVSTTTQIAPVPSFINYINTIDSNGNRKSEILIPPGVTDGTGSGPYYDFRGVCGKVKVTDFGGQLGSIVDKLEVSGVTGLRLPNGSINQEHPLIKATLNARHIAVQQMIQELSATANLIVNNVYRDESTGEIRYRYDGLGFWLPATGENRRWVGSAAQNTGPMLTGYELVYAVNAYVSLVRPSLRLMQTALGDMSTSYTQLAREQGWIMAGSFFYDLIKSTDEAVAVTFQPGTVSGVFSYDQGVLTNGTAGSSCSLSGGPCKINYYNNGANATAVLDSTDINNSATPLGVPTYWAVGATSPNDQVEKYIQAALTSQETITSSAGQRTSPIKLGLPPIPYLGPNFVKCTFYFNLLKMIGVCAAAGLESLMRFLGDRIIDLINWIVIPPVSMVFFQPLSQAETIFSAGLAGSYEPGKNPVVELAKTGQVFMTMAVNILVGVLIWGLFAVLAGFIVGITIPIFLIIAPIMIMAAVAIFSYGIVLSYYVPLIPYIIFTFASIGWFIAVIEAMVAAPIVALGLAHPEGHETLGKADQAVLLLANVFLRPSLLVIGFLFAIILSYVLITLFNAGFMRINDSIIALMKGELSSRNVGSYGLGSHSVGTPFGTVNANLGATDKLYQFDLNEITKLIGLPPTASTSGFSNFLAPLFMITIYIAVYLQIVEKSFEIIYLLPDQVMNWIGGRSSGISTQMAQGQTAEMKKSTEQTAAAGQKMGKAASAGAKKGASMAGDAVGSAGGGGGGGTGEASAGGAEAPPDGG